MKLLKNLLVYSVKFYRNYLSPLKLRTCRFYPTCSEYTLECLERFGAIKGVFKSVGRILKCHPFHPGGFDPVDTQTSLRGGNGDSSSVIARKPEGRPKQSQDRLGTSSAISK